MPRPRRRLRGGARTGQHPSRALPLAQLHGRALLRSIFGGRLADSEQRSVQRAGGRSRCLHPGHERPLLLREPIRSAHGRGPSGRCCQQFGTGDEGLFFSAFSEAETSTYFCSDQKGLGDAVGGSWEFETDADRADFTTRRRLAGRQRARLGRERRRLGTGAGAARAPRDRQRAAAQRLRHDASHHGRRRRVGHRVQLSQPRPTSTSSTRFPTCAGASARSSMA